MAKAGFRIMDSDIHVDEPHDLWDRYLEPRFKDRAPRFAAIDGSHMNGWQFEGKVFPAFFDRPERRRLGRIRREKARARHLETGRLEELTLFDPATGKARRGWAPPKDQATRIPGGTIPLGGDRVILTPPRDERPFAADPTPAEQQTRRAAAVSLLLGR